jgi:hypothetical protein
VRATVRITVIVNGVVAAAAAAPAELCERCDGAEDSFGVRDDGLRERAPRESAFVFARMLRPELRAMVVRGRGLGGTVARRLLL